MMSDLQGELDRFEMLATKLLEATPKSRTGDSISTVSINAGGIGVWVATTCCFIMLACASIGSIWISREFNRVDSELQSRKQENEKMQSYLSVIYQKIPTLKPDESKKSN